jgi:hypothetical protein
MNQGIAFARTIRALDADDFRRSKFTLLIAGILLVGWTWWMLAARVPQYETSTNVRIESDRAIAYFPSTDHIRPGQPAFVTLASDRIPARVQNVTTDHAELVFTNSQQPRTNDQQPTTARVEVSSASPADIAFRTLGRAHQ